MSLINSTLQFTYLVRVTKSFILLCVSNITRIVTRTNQLCPLLFKSMFSLDHVLLYGFNVAFHTWDHPMVLDLFSSPKESFYFFIFFERTNLFVIHPDLFCLSIQKHVRITLRILPYSHTIYHYALYDLFSHSNKINFFLYLVPMKLIFFT